jgi:hypothetical protein
LHPDEKLALIGEDAGLRHAIGAIFQDYLRYNLLVRENIGFVELQAAGCR